MREKLEQLNTTAAKKQAALASGAVLNLIIIYVYDV